MQSRKTAGPKYEIRTINPSANPMNWVNHNVDYSSKQWGKHDLTLNSDYDEDTQRSISCITFFLAVILTGHRYTFRCLDLHSTQQHHHNSEGKHRIEGKTSGCLTNSEDNRFHSRWRQALILSLSSLLYLLLLIFSLVGEM